MDFSPPVLNLWSLPCAAQAPGSGFLEVRSAHAWCAPRCSPPPFGPGWQTPEGTGGTLTARSELPRFLSVCPLCPLPLPPQSPPTRSDRASHLHNGGWRTGLNVRHRFFLEIRTRRMFQPSNHPAGKERPAPHRKWESGGPASAQEWGSEPGLCDPPPQPLPGELCGEGQSPGPSSAPRYLWDSPCAEACPGWSVVLSVKGGAAQISPPCLAGQTPHGFPSGWDTNASGCQR